MKLNISIPIILIIGLTISPVAAVYAKNTAHIVSQPQEISSDEAIVDGDVEALASTLVSAIPLNTDVHSKLSWFKSLLFLSLVTYINSSLSILLHECGHGFTALALGQEVIEWDLKPILYLMGTPSVSFIPSESAAKNILIFAAGPLAGIAGGIVLSKISAALSCHFLTKNKKDQPVIDAYSKLLETYSSLWTTFAHFSNFIPIILFLNLNDGRSIQQPLSDGAWIQAFLESLSSNLASAYPTVVMRSTIALFGYSAYRIYKAGKEFYASNKQPQTQKVIIA